MSMWTIRRAAMAILGFPEVEARRVDAVTQSSGSGAIVEDVTEVPTASRTAYFGSYQPVAPVFPLLDAALDDCARVRGPSATGVELVIGGEQLDTASRTDVGAIVLAIPVFTRECPLGLSLAKHGVLHRRERSPPLLIRLHEPVSP